MTAPADAADARPDGPGGPGAPDEPTAPSGPVSLRLPDAPAPARELTPRALLVGGAIGAALAAGNVYTGLKTSFIDGGSITAAVMGFAFFAALRRRAGAPYSALENNITQTTAASAGIMGFVLGTSGPLPALRMLGAEFVGLPLALWGIALALVGIFVAAALRRRLIVREALPFPTGAATAEMIETIHAARESALRRARTMVLAGLAAACVTWFRDGRPVWLPQTWMLPVAIAGLPAASLTLGVGVSPLLASTGVFMGFRAAGSMLVGGAVAWLGLAPWLVRRGIVPSASYGAIVAWLVWPGLGLVMGSTLAPLALDWRGTARSLRDLRSVLRRRARRAGATGDEGENGALVARERLPFETAMLGACVAALLVLGRITFGLHPASTLAALALSVALAAVCARAAGETDIAPIGSAGMLTQLLFAGRGAVTSLVAGSIAAGDASQTAQTLWALKSGQRLRGSPRAQLIAQIAGAILGGVVVVPVYVAIVRGYGVGTEAMPAPAALSWKATAEAVRGGFAAMPPYAPQAGAMGFAIGVGLCLLGRSRRLGRFAPSPTAIGIALLTPASLSATVFLGAAAAAAARRRWPRAAEAALTPIAAGAMAGESLMGVLVAALSAGGVI
jgi:OPT family oligopeptide transporter